MDTMKDLYRIVPYDFETEDESVFVGRREMLVKVEPDFEAAKVVLTRFNIPDEDVDAAVDAVLEGIDK